MLKSKHLYAVLALLACTIAVGCSSDDDGGAPPEPTATVTVVPPASATPEPTVAATPTATHEHTGPEHLEVGIGSTEDGGGELAAEFDFDQVIPVFFDTCLGGGGDECSGGIRLFSTVNPGFSPIGHDHDEHEHGAASNGHAEHDDDNGHGHGEELFPLLDGTAVSLEVIAIDAGLSMRIEGTTLNSPGQAVVLGEAPHFHSDAETFISLGDGEEEGDFHMSFRLTTDAPEYQPSHEHTLRFTTDGGDDHDHDDDDEHEDDHHEEDDDDHGHGH